MNHVKIIGAGLAGSEAAWQAVSNGVDVVLSEMRPEVMTKAHKSPYCAELVCSNSFRGADLSNAVGLLKKELSTCGSLIMEAALLAAVPAGGALAVDREIFSKYIDEKIRTHPRITIRGEEITTIPQSSVDSPVIIATGPLTSRPLARAIEELTGEGHLSFYDAISPIIVGDSINQEETFRQSRYDKGGDDYINLPLSREEYYAFVEAVKNGEKYAGHDQVENEGEVLRPFEGCMPIEDMIERGPDTLLFGPFKSVGLIDPRTGRKPYAVAQLRQDDKAGTLWSMVGMQTRLKQGEQLRIFRTLPGLKDAEFVRLGTMHRNTFMNSPRCLNSTLEFRTRPGLFFAGQITGVEGYVESTAGGLVAGINAARLLQRKEPISFPESTAIGSLMKYISDPERKDFQPMNISFGLMPCYHQAELRNSAGKKIPKKDRRLQVSEAAIESVEKFIANCS